MRASIDGDACLGEAILDLFAQRLCDLQGWDRCVRPPSVVIVGS